MKWNRSTTIGLAQMKCGRCQGFGMRRSQQRGTLLPCDCVFRSIFRACYKRFRECVQMEKRLSLVTVDWTLGNGAGKRFYGRKIEEYIADFCNIGRRVLGEKHYQIFRYHFVLGGEWSLCCRQLKIDKGVFFHRVYRVMAVLGRAFAETEPYGLFPVDEYFGTVIRRGQSAAVQSIQPERRPR